MSAYASCVASSRISVERDGLETDREVQILSMLSVPVASEKRDYDAVCDCVGTDNDDLRRRDSWLGIGMDQNDPLKRVSTADLHSVAHLEQLQDAREKTAEVLYKVQSKRIRDNQQPPAKRSQWQIVVRFLTRFTR